VEAIFTTRVEKMEAHPTWNEYLAKTWKKYLPPIRPAPEELAIFGRLLERELQNKRSNITVLILGSTPELRDLVLSHHLVPTVVDYSEANYLALTTLMAQRGKEHFVNQNWPNMEIGETFDVILSEAASTVVSCKMNDRFFERMHAHLKPDGVMLAKTWVRPNNQRPDMIALIADYRERLSHKDFYSAICLPLFVHFYDYEKEVVAVRYMSAQMKDLHDRGVITDSEWETIHRHEYKKVTLELYIPYIDDIRTLMSKHFYIEDIIPAGFDYSEYHPIFVLRPRPNQTSDCRSIRIT